jgi:transcriptional regulator NrdR family protein
MLCPLCKTKLKTTNSRANSSGLGTWRRKHCPHCNLTLTSKEVLDLSPLLSSPNFQYSRTKLNRELLSFCSKSNQEFISNILQTIEINLLKLNHGSKLNNTTYNSTILEILEKLDHPASLRYQAHLSDH